MQCPMCGGAELVHDTRARAWGCEPCANQLAFYLGAYCSGKGPAYDLARFSLGVETHVRAPPSKSRTWQA